jgi:hypothetical protein
VTTTGHIGPMVRTLMKDAREVLVRISGLSPQHFVQVRLARVQPASHHRWQCKVIVYLFISTLVAPACVVIRLVRCLMRPLARA